MTTRPAPVFSDSPASKLRALESGPRTHRRGVTWHGEPARAGDQTAPRRSCGARTGGATSSCGGSRRAARGARGWATTPRTPRSRRTSRPRPPMTPSSPLPPPRRRPRACYSSSSSATARSSSTRPPLRSSLPHRDPLRARQRARGHPSPPRPSAPR